MRFLTKSESKKEEQGDSTIRDKIAKMKPSIELTEVEDDYERSDHLKYMVMTQDIKESGF